MDKQETIAHVLRVLIDLQRRNHEPDSDAWSTLDRLEARLNKDFPRPTGAPSIASFPTP